MIEISTGPCSLPLQGIADLIAACPTFQAKVGCGTQIGASAFCHVGKVDYNNPPELLHHYAIITDDDLCTWELDRFFKSAGQVLVTFEFLSNPLLDVDSKAALLDYTNTVGAIICEMFERANTPSADGQKHFWNATKATRLVAPSLCDLRNEDCPNEPGELFFESAFIFDWV